MLRVLRDFTGFYGIIGYLKRFLGVGRDFKGYQGNLRIFMNFNGFNGILRESKGIYGLSGILRVLSDFKGF